MRMFRLATFLVGSLIALLASAACGGEEPSIPIVGVTAADFSFSLPDTIAGGLVRFQLTNSGQDSHHMQVVKLNQGVSQQQFQGPLQETLQAIPQEGEAALGRLFQIVTFNGRSLWHWTGWRVRSHGRPTGRRLCTALFHRWR